MSWFTVCSTDRRECSTDGDRHRSQVAHECSAPLDFNERQEAAVQRKSRAQEVLARTMPGFTGRVIPKPPPGRDVQRIQTNDEEVEAVQSPPSGDAATPRETLPTKGKSKADKVYEMHLRKLRSLAKPLDGSQKPNGVERRFFECATDEKGDLVKRWEEEGKWEGKLERVWVKTVSLLYLRAGSRLIGI